MITRILHWIDWKFLVGIWGYQDLKRIMEKHSDYEVLRQRQKNSETVPNTFSLPIFLIPAVRLFWYQIFTIPLRRLFPIFPIPIEKWIIPGTGTVCHFLWGRWWCWSCWSILAQKRRKIMLKMIAMIWKQLILAQERNTEDIYAEWEVIRRKTSSVK